MDVVSRVEGCEVHRGSDGTAYIVIKRFEIFDCFGEGVPEGEALYGAFDDSEGGIAMYDGGLGVQGTEACAYVYGAGVADDGGDEEAYPDADGLADVCVCYACDSGGTGGAA